MRKDDRPVVLALAAIAAGLMLNAAAVGDVGPVQSFLGKILHEPANFFSAVLALLTSVLAWASVRQGKQTQQSIDLARNEFLTTHRPRIRTRWFNQDSSQTIMATVNLHVNNVGASRAPVSRVKASVLAIKRMPLNQNDPANLGWSDYE